MLCILQVRKPLVEKKRRARINESLRELRTLLADADVSWTRARRITCLRRYPVRLFLRELLSPFQQIHSKMENAEVLEMTVKKVEDILKNPSQGMHTSTCPVCALKPPSRTRRCRPRRRLWFHCIT